MHDRCRHLHGLALVVAVAAAASGCRHPIPVQAQFQGAVQAAAQADVRGEVAIKLPAAIDPGPMVAFPVRPSPRPEPGPAQGPRIAVIDVDGLLLNQTTESLLGGGENPVALFREKLTAAAADGRVAALVLRIHSPGGGVTASDIMADELDRFRACTRKPVVACLMDVATSGAYYLAVGADRVVAQPTAVTGGIGTIFNHVNLQDAMAQLNVGVDPVKAGPRIDMGSVAGPLEPETRALLEGMAAEFHRRFLDRVARRRPGMKEADRRLLADGRIVSAPQAMRLGLVDRLGSLHDAIQEAESLAAVPNAEVVMYHRAGRPPRSLYDTDSSPPRLSDAIPLSYPGLDRGKLPTFLYLWQPDPTISRVMAR